MAPYCVTEGQRFRKYSNLPRELRKMVINRMETVDRCRFSGTSKSTLREVIKSSRHFVHEMAFYATRETYVEIKMVYDSYLVEKDGEKGCRRVEQGYKLIFEKDNSGKFMKYMCMNGRLCWKRKLHVSIQLTRFALQHFNRLLDGHQNNTMKLTLIGRLLQRYIIGYGLRIHRLTNVEVLECDDAVHIETLLAMIPNPLKTLIHCGDRNTDLKPIFQKICQMRNMIFIPKIPIDYEQLLQLNFIGAIVSTDKLTVENIVDYIERWKSGKLFDQFERIVWMFGKVKFDVESFFDHFRKTPKENYRIRYYHIKQTIPNGKTALVRFLEKGQGKAIDLVVQKSE